MEMSQHYLSHMVLVALLSLVLVNTGMALQGDSEEYLIRSNTIELRDDSTSNVQRPTAELSGILGFMKHASINQAREKRSKIGTRDHLNSKSFTFSSLLLSVECPRLTEFNFYVYR
jgi:hypothetical protein